MGLFDKVRESLAEARERVRLEEAARYQRMAPYRRGYDVYPDEVRRHFGIILRREYIVKVLRDTVIIGLCALGCIFLIKDKSDAVMFIFIPLIVGLIMLFVWISDVRRLMRLEVGSYDLFGAMVTNTRIEEHTTTDSDGSSSTSYNYFVTLNGIECEVSSKEYRKVSVETYCYFIRFPAKYIKDDKFYFFPSDVAEAQQRIGQHYPGREMRLRSAPRGKGYLIFLAVLVLFFCFITCCIGLMANVRAQSELMQLWQDNWQLIGASSGIIGAALILLHRHYINEMAEQQLEEKRRRYGDSQ
ncbi:MAG: hypothetical protein IJ561_07410 [Ruminococcus sp.]|nr:hypothetical protein [Ruminococcus sp.]